MAGRCNETQNAEPDICDVSSPVEHPHVSAGRIGVAEVKNACLGNDVLMDDPCKRARVDVDGGQSGRPSQVDGQDAIRRLRQNNARGGEFSVLDEHR